MKLFNAALAMVWGQLMTACMGHQIFFGPDGTKLHEVTCNGRRRTEAHCMKAANKICKGPYEIVDRESDKYNVEMPAMGGTTTQDTTISGQPGYYRGYGSVDVKTKTTSTATGAYTVSEVDRRLVFRCMSDPVGGVATLPAQSSPAIPLPASAPAAAPAH